MRAKQNLWGAPLLAIAASSWLACSAGSVGGFTGSPSGGASGASSGAGLGGSGAATSGLAGGGATGNGGSGSAVAGDGGVMAITPGTGMTIGWYESLLAADFSRPTTALPATRIWRLSSRQWANTVQVAMGAAVDPTLFPADTIDPQTGFSHDSSVNMITQALAQTYFDVGGQVATSAAAGASTTWSCLGTAPVSASCAQQFVGDYGSRLFRRPLTSAENTLYTTFLTSQSQLDPPAVAVSSVLQAMLLSPNFAYRTELGSSTPGQVTLTGNEIASLLSYTIADMPPDAPLLQAGAAGQLADATAREAQARRLMALPGARLKLADFWQQYLALGSIPASAGITADLGAAMVKETQTFFDKVVWGPSPGTFSTLLTANYTYADPVLAKFYGSATPDPVTGRLALTPGQRSGFLTQASLLAKSSAPSQAATVIHRGLLVRERLLCEIPPPPPPGFVPNPAMIMLAGANATAKQNYDLFAMTQQTCNACHVAFQPIGLGFESYDSFGNFRTAYAAPISQPVVTGGTLTAAGDATGPYGDITQLAANIGKSQIGQYCFTDQFAQFALGRSVDLNQEACTVRSMGDFVTGKGGAIQELLTSLAHVDTAYRRFHQ